MAVARTVLLVDGVAQQVREQAPWGFGWNTIALASGTHALQVQAQDVAGNVGSSSTVSVTVNNPAMDTTPPNVQFTTPANGSTLSGQAAFTVAATDEVAVAKVIVTLRPDDANYNSNSYDPGRNTRMFTLTTAPYTVTVNTSEFVPGTYNLRAEAVDTSGNRTLSEKLVVSFSNSDSQGPTVSFVAPTANATIGGRYNVKATASDNGQVKRVDFYLDYNTDSQKLIASRSKVGDPDPIGRVYSVYWDTSEEIDGIHTLSAIATDVNGNTSASFNGFPAATITVHVTNPAPTVSIQSPVSGATVGGTQVAMRVAYSATSPADKPINKLELLVDGVVRVTKNLTNTHPSGQETILWNSTGVSDGTHTLRVKAYDTRDTSKNPANMGQSGTVTATVDNTNDIAPQSALLDSPYNITYNGVSLRWSANADTDFVRYEVHKSVTQGFTPDATTLVVAISNRSSLATRLSPLATATTYYFRIRVVDATNHTSDSNEVTATTPSDDATTPTSGATIETEYNLADKIIAVHDWLGVTTAEHDELNRDKKITDVYGRSTQYEYDANGNRSALVYHDATRVEYQYDAANRLTTVTKNQSPITAYQYL